MAGISVSGLISNSFDWKSIVDQLINIDSAPVARLQTEESDNIDKLAAFSSLQTKLSDLNTASEALKADGLFNKRTASSSTSGSGWSASAANSADAGNYTIAVTKLATNARLNGKSAIAAPLNAAATDYDPDTNPDGIDGLTLANLPTATAITAGKFTVNGKPVNILLTDSLADVFDKIHTADSSVTASYDGATDKITLSSASEIVLGAANDSSNFLSAMRLANSGTGTVTSASSLGAVDTKVPLASGRLGGTLGPATGSLSVNGVSIAYDTASDSLSTILARITASTAGVTASYDTANNRVVLTNKATGDTGVGVADEDTGTLASVLGLTTGAGATLARGNNAEFSINGGGTISSASNTLDENALGVAGLSVTVNTATTQTINVAADTGSMQTAIQSFITKFNAVQSYIDSQTKITKTPDGKVTAALLADNHEVQGWASEMRSMAFSQVTGAVGSISRLDALGLDFNSTDSTLSIKDSAKLTAALTGSGDDVAAYFNAADTGFASKFSTYLDNKLDTQNGGLQLQMDTLNRSNTDIEAQIATLNSRLTDERERLTTAFLAMQTAQSNASQQQTTLNQFIKSSSSS